MEGRVLKVLTLDNPRDCERRLFAALGTDHHELIRLLVKNKAIVAFGTRLQQAQNQADRDAVIKEMELTHEGRELLEEIAGKKNVLGEAELITSRYK